MSQKVKSSMFLGVFIAVYSFYITATDASFPESNTTQVAAVDMQQDTQIQNLEVISPE